MSMISKLGRWALSLALIWGGTHVVRTLRDLPPAQAGVITLPAGTTWLVAGHVDLQGARLYSPAPCAIHGMSAETCSLTSTGLTGAALITVAGTLQLATLSLIMPAGELCVSVTGDGITTALDWQLVNFTGAGRALEASNINNFVGETLGLLAGDGFYFTGSANSIVFTDSILTPASGGKGVDVTGATVNRRLRLTNSALVIGAGATGVGAAPSNITLSEGMILDTCNFSGAGTYVTTIDYLSDKARWIECRGIQNTTRAGELYLVTPAETVNPGPGVFVKLAGTTAAKATNQRFAHADNRLTYTSALATNALITAVLTLDAGNGDQLTVAAFKGGVEVPGSRQTVTANVAGRVESLTLQTTTPIVLDDYTELWVASSAAGNITAQRMNLIVRAI